MKFKIERYNGGVNLIVGDSAESSARIFRVVPNPRRWQVGQFHFYYDGDNCIYDLGPFTYVRQKLRGRKKCSELF